MSAKQGDKQTSNSPKEKEKLKRRLQTLFKQQEQTTKQMKSPKSVQNKNLPKGSQQVNGEPAKKQSNQNSNVKYKNKLKSVKNKPTKEINTLPNGGKAQQNNDKQLPSSSKQQSHSLDGTLGNNRKQKQKESKKNKKLETLSSATNLHTDHQKVQKKNNKLKQNIAKKSKNESAPQPTKKLPHPEVPVGNKGQNKLTKNQKKRAKKRNAAAASLSNQTKASKNPKLEHQETKANSKKAKNKKFKSQKNQRLVHLPRNGVINNDEFDVSSMSGLVTGGEFNEDFIEDEEYWNQDQTNHINSDDDSDNEEDFYEIYNQEQNGVHGTTFDTSEYDDYESGDDPYNYSDLREEELSDNNSSPEENEWEEENSYDGDELGDDPYNYSDNTEEEEVEEENYSDFDEDDYEEDEDSFSYSSDDSEFSSDSDASDINTEKVYDSHDSGEADEDYKLPKHVLEDLVIHSGTATKRDLLPEDKVDFKDKKYMQVVELKDQAIVKVIRQPKEYQREELLKLTYKENHNIKIVVADTKHEKVKSSTDSEVKDDCPKLVPIVDEDGFQLYNPNEDEEDADDVENDYDDESMSEEAEDSLDEYEENDSLGSEYTELNSDDADSMVSEDINDKYLNRHCNDEDVCYSSDEENSYLAAQQKADVIDATNCDFITEGIMVENETTMSDQLHSHVLSKLVKMDSKANIITIPVIDEKLLKDKANFKEDEFEQTSNSIKATSLSEARTNDLKQTSYKNEITEKGPTQQQIKPLATAIPIVQVTVTEKPECDSKEAKESSTRLKNTNQSLADYKTIFCNAINANLVLVLLKQPLYIYGTVRLTLLAGVVEIYGHTLTKDKEVELFSPRGCSEIEITSTQSPAKEFISKDKLKSILKQYDSNFILSDLERIALVYEPGKDAVVLLKRNEERKKIVQQFKKFMNENVFPNLQNISMDRPLYSSEYLLRCMINISATEYKSLRLPQQWHTLEVTKQSRIMLVGGKGVGKSTLLRFLINKHLSLEEKVLLIDLDIGQPEIFVPQTVSCSVVEKPLLGPGFLLNVQPEKSYVVGNTNIALCPHKYVEAVRNLVRYCLAQEKFQNIPWCINTMGYNKGFGPELISVIASELPLTDVIQLQSNKDINNFDSLLFPLVVSKIPRNMFVEDVEISKQTSLELSYRLHVWQSAVVQESRYQKEWGMSPKDMRYAILLARLSEALQGHADWLTDCKPMSAPLDQLKLINLTDDIPLSSSEELAKAMEANLVYLCHYVDDSVPVECLGIGVVRAIDYHVQQLYLLPAMSSPSSLKRVNCLALGEMPLPSSLFTNQGSGVQKTAPFVYNTIEAKASKAIKQIYHRPSKFLKGNHKSMD